jgi:hypothetical protein
MKKLAISLLFVTLNLQATQLAFADCSDAYSYAKKGYNSDNIDDVHRYAKKAMNAAEECRCEDAYGYARKAYRSDDLDEATNYMRKAKSAADDCGT